MRFPWWRLPDYDKAIADMDKRLEALPSDKPAHEHDWRVNPDGWQPDRPWWETSAVGVESLPDGVTAKQSLLSVCATCGQAKKDWRINPELASWPKGES